MAGELLQGERDFEIPVALAQQRLTVETYLCICACCTLPRKVAAVKTAHVLCVDSVCLL